MRRRRSRSRRELERAQSDVSVHGPVDGDPRSPAGPSQFCGTHCSACAQLPPTRLHGEEQPNQHDLAAMMAKAQQQREDPSAAAAAADAPTTKRQPRRPPPPRRSPLSAASSSRPSANRRARRRRRRRRAARRAGGADVDVDARGAREPGGPAGGGAAARRADARGVRAAPGPRGSSTSRGRAVSDEVLQTDCLCRCRRASPTCRACRRRTPTRRRSPAAPRPSCCSRAWRRSWPTTSAKRCSPSTANSPRRASARRWRR